MQNFAESAQSGERLEIDAERELEPPRRRRGFIRSVKYLVSPGRMWYYSTLAYQAKLYPLAYFIKLISWMFFHSLLSFQCEVEDDIELVHYGMGCTSHPNVTIGRRVKIFHMVSMAAETPPGSSSRIIIEDDVVIGAHAIILGNDDGGIRIGKGAVIGAGAIVNRDVPAGSAVLAMPSRPVKMVKKWD